MLAYARFSRAARNFYGPNIAAYFLYFAVILLPLCVCLNTRDAPVGRTLVWATVALSAVTHAALAVFAYLLWRA